MKNSSSSDSEESYEEKNPCCGNNPPPDFYCSVCKSSMNSNFTWQMHVSGKRHIKNMTQASYGKRKSIKARLGTRIKKMTTSPNRTNRKRRRTEALPGIAVQNIKCVGNCPPSIPTIPSDERAQIQTKFDKINDTAVVGLEFVNEIWRLDKNLEPMYHCSLCNATCQVITISNHVTGFRHRLQYLKQVNRYEYERVNNSNERKSILSERVANYARKAQKQHGKGSVKMSYEIYMVHEENSSSEESGHKSEPTPPVPVKPKPIKMDVRKVKPQEIVETYKAIDSADRAKILKTFCSKEALENPKAFDDVNRKLFIDTYIEAKIKELTDDEHCKMVQECMEFNFVPLITYFKLEELTAVKYDLHLNFRK